MRFAVWVLLVIVVLRFCVRVGCGVSLGLVSLVVFMLSVVGLVGCCWICGLLLVCLVVVCDVGWWLNMVWGVFDNVG